MLKSRANCSRLSSITIINTLRLKCRDYYYYGMLVDLSKHHEVSLSLPPYFNKAKSNKYRQCRWILYHWAIVDWCILRHLTSFMLAQVSYLLILVSFVFCCLDAPEITHISAPQTPNRGEMLTLNCTADGNPAPNITWTRLSNGDCQYAFDCRGKQICCSLQMYCFKWDGNRLQRYFGYPYVSRDWVVFVCLSTSIVSDET